MTGRYMAWKKREMGFSSSGRKRLPRMNSTIRTGTTVIASIEENAIANDLGVGQRTEHPSLLRFEQEHRQK